MDTITPQPIQTLRSDILITYISISKGEKPITDDYSNFIASIACNSSNILPLLEEEYNRRIEIMIPKILNDIF